MEVRIVEFPETNVAAAEHRGPPALEYETSKRLIQWRLRNGISPQKVAATVILAIEANPPRSFYAVGSNAPFVFVLRRMVPRAVVERMVARRHGLP